jgi:cysteine-S-conjugate beta-lyase
VEGIRGKQNAADRAFGEYAASRPPRKRRNVVADRPADVGGDFDRVVERRGTSSLKWDFGRRFVGTDGLLPLWVADMDFEAPAEIVNAIKSRVDHHVYGYTLEPESLFEAAAAWLVRRHRWEVAREWMIASPGVIPALVAVILGLTEPGDGVVIQPPVYHPFALRIAANGRRVVENPLTCAGGTWEMDLEGLERAVDARSRLLILCSPHNPVARVWSRRTLQRLAEICTRKGIVIVSDEIHSDIVMEGFHHVPVAALPEAAPISVTLTAVTKSFNLAGLGGSLTIVPDARLRARVDGAHHAIFAGVANAPAAAAAEAAWRHGEPWLEGLLEYVGGNYRFLCDRLAERLPAVKVHPLEGTYLAWLDMRGLELSDDQVIERLRRDAGLWLDEGRKFGRGGEGFQRLNLACPRRILSDGVDRLVRAFVP